MSAANNPAGRLYQILQNAKSQRDWRGKHGHEIWPILLNTSPDNRALLLKRLGQLMEQVDLAKEAIRRDSDVDHEVYLRWTGTIESAFSSLNINSNFASFIDPITDVALHGLEFCKDRLARIAGEKLLNDDERERLSADAKSLMDEVLASDLSDELKRFILDRLDSVIQALDSYPVCGAKPLEIAVQATIGIVATQKDIVTQAQDAPIGKKMWKILGRAAMLSQIIGATLQITDFVDKHKEDSQPQVEQTTKREEPTKQ